MALAKLNFISATLVDTVTALMGGTATLFVRSGDDFVRVSTNVKLDDPKGKAIVATRDAPSTTRPLHTSVHRDRAPTRFGNALQVSSACPTHCNDSPTTKPEPPYRRALPENHSVAVGGCRHPRGGAPTPMSST